MGFFSWECCACHNSILNVYSSTLEFTDKDGNKQDGGWLSEVTFVGKANAEYLDFPSDGYTKDGTVYVSGMYNGYGSIEGEEFEFLDVSPKDYRLFHHECWRAVGEPDIEQALRDFAANDSCKYQGHFIDVNFCEKIKKPEGFALY